MFATFKISSNAFTFMHLQFIRDECVLIEHQLKFNRIYYINTIIISEAFSRDNNYNYTNKYSNINNKTVKCEQFYKTDKKTFHLLTIRFGESCVCLSVRMYIDVNVIRLAVFEKAYGCLCCRF